MTHASSRAVPYGFYFLPDYYIFLLKFKGNWLCDNDRRMSTGGPCYQSEGDYADSCSVHELLAEAVTITSRHCMELHME